MTMIFFAVSRRRPADGRTLAPPIGRQHKDPLLARKTNQRTNWQRTQVQSAAPEALHISLVLTLLQT